MRKKKARKLSTLDGKSARKVTENAKQMIKIENYAKENNITITKAMIHFMK